MAEHGFNDPAGLGSTSKANSVYGFSDNYTILGLNSAFKNLFEVSLLPNIESPNLADFPVRNIKGISLDNFKFNFKRDPLTRKNKLSSDVLVYYGDVSIDWMEDDRFSVYKFHDKWKKYYYDEASQTWVVGPYNRFISLKVRVNIASANIFSNQDGPGASLTQNQLTLELKNISLPKALPTLDLEYNKADEISYKLAYPVEQITPSITTYQGTTSGNRRNI